MQTDTPQRRLKEKLREVRTGLILDVAEKVLVEKGYRDTSMDEIAARAGVAKGTLYQHFSRKEDLVFALFERELEKTLQTVEQIVATDLPARARLERILRQMYGELLGKRMQLLFSLLTDMDFRKGLLEKKLQMRDRMQELAKGLRAVLEEGKEDGSFDPAIPTVVMLMTFFGLLSPHGIEHLVAQDQLSPEELVSSVERIYFTGINAKK